MFLIDSALFAGGSFDPQARKVQGARARLRHQRTQRSFRRNLRGPTSHDLPGAAYTGAVRTHPAPRPLGAPLVESIRPQ
jgi:hypothetical protein